MSGIKCAATIPGTFLLPEPDTEVDASHSHTYLPAAEVAQRVLYEGFYYGGIVAA